MQDQMHKMPDGHIMPDSDMKKKMGKKKMKKPSNKSYSEEGMMMAKKEMMKGGM